MSCGRRKGESSSILKNFASEELNEDGSKYSGTTSQTRCTMSERDATETPVDVTHKRAAGMSFRSKLVKRFSRRLLGIKKRKGVILVFVLEVLRGFAFYGTLAPIFQFIFGRSFYASVTGSAVQTIAQNVLGGLMYPIGGFLADVYFGRHKMIRVGLWLLWIANAILAVSFSLQTYTPPALTRFTVPVLALIVMGGGTVSLHVNLIPFGVDQLEGEPADKVSSYFYWYYWATNVGSLLAFLCILALTKLFPAEVAIGAMVPLTSAIVLTIAIGLHVILADWFEIDNQTKNPLRLVAKVLWYAATAKRTSPQRRRAFRYGELPPPRIDLAKIEYDGIYTHEQVEDVKIFCLILLLNVSLGGFDLAYYGLSEMITHRGLVLGKAAVVSPSEVMLYFMEHLVHFASISTKIITIPILNHVIIPLLDIYTPNMRKRMGIGIFLIIPSALLLALIEGYGYGSVSTTGRILLLMLPAVLMGIISSLLYVSSLEFIYAQSPHNMKGFLVGLFFCRYGFWVAVSGIIFLGAPDSEYLCSTSASTGYHIANNCIFWYYIIFIGAGIFAFILYVAVAILYKNRERDNVENENARILEYFTTSSSKSVESTVSL